MEKRAARERVHLFQTRGLLARAELKDSVQSEAIRARGEMLERGWRIAAIGEAVRLESLERGGIGIDNAVGVEPAVAPAPAASAQRSGERCVRLHQVARASRRRRAAQFQCGLKRSEIVFGVVDGVARVGGRRPIQARGSGAGGAFLEFPQGRQAAFGGAHHFERVEGRHAGAGLRDVHARIRDHQALGGGRGGGTEQHAFARRRDRPACRRPAASWMRCSSSNSGSSKARRGKSPSASPGRNTTSKLRPRASSMEPTKTRP